MMISTAAQAVTITVDSQLDLIGGCQPSLADCQTFTDTSPNTSFTAAGPLPGLPGSFTPGNGTPGVCTLREAILSANGDIAVTAAPDPSLRDCQDSSYCPFNASGTRITGECVQGANNTPDEIIFTPATRGTIALNYSLPAITDPVRIVGLGPDQTILTGFAPYLGALTPPTTGAGAAANPTVDLPVFQVSPDLESGAIVSIESLQVLGTRTHYFRNAQADAATCDLNAATAAPAVDCTNFRGRSSVANCDGTNSGGAGGNCNALVPAPDCETTADNDSFPTCPSTATLAANKRVINFGGLVMDNGVSAERKQLSLLNTRFTCNRRDAGNNQGGAPFANRNATGVVTPFAIAGFQEGRVALPVTSAGGAISVVGRAAVNLTTATFSNNIADVGDGGAVSVAAKDNGSPSLTIGATSVFNNQTFSCVDTVVATDSSDTSTAAGIQLANRPVFCSGVTPLPLICPAVAAVTVYAPYFPGNLAGTTEAFLSGPPVVGTPAGGLARNGGAIDVNGGTAVVGNIGQVDIRDTQFLNNAASGNGGAISLRNVARSATTLPAFLFDRVLFGGAAGSGNSALGNGGGVFIQGHTNTPALTSFEFTSFGNNTATGNGGALFYVTSPGAPVDFSIENVRFGNNTAAAGGAIFATDNTVDDSGLLNLNKVTLNGNTATAAAGGGAIFCGASKGGSQVTNVTISGNTALNGGGIQVGNRCHFDINSSTITANTASVSGGGISVPAATQNARVDIRNSILAGNITPGPVSPPGCDLVAGGANPDCVSASAGAPLLGDCDGTNAGGAGGNCNAVASAPDCETTADNDSFPTCPPIGADCAAPDNNILRSAGLGTATPGVGFNFVGTALGCGVANTTNRPFLGGRNPVTGACENPSFSTGDFVGGFVDRRAAAAGQVCSGTLAPLNPTLRVLQDNGGPEILGARNFTHHPDTGSQVVNNADRAGCKNGFGTQINEDQREFARPATVSGVVTRCDIGALETGTIPTDPITAVASCQPGVGNLHQLQNVPTEKEMMRFTVNAPNNAGTTVRALRIQAAAPGAGVAGNYSSVNKIIVRQENPDGTRVLLLDIARPANFVLGATVDFNLTTPVPVPVGTSRVISVSYEFGPSSQLAMSERATLIAGGLAFLPILGLVAVGRRRLALAVLVVAATLATTSCGDSGGETIVNNTAPTPIDRTFKTAVTAVFIQGTTGPAFVGNLSCDTVTVRPLR